VGPPVVNLQDQIFPLSIYSLEGGRRQPILKSVNQTEKTRITFFEFQVSEELDFSKPQNLQVVLANGWEQEIVVQSFPHEHVDIQVATLQKNNPVRWVEDWVDYYSSLGIGRVLLYDNGSANIDELSRRLERSKTDVQLILVHWPFPFRPLRSYYNAFCKAGFSNHSHQLFRKSGWTGHFDLDEYPVLRPGLSLGELLESQAQDVGVISLDGYWVPCSIEMNPDKELDSISARDFPFREKQSRNKGYKYFLRSSAYKEAKTHTGVTVSPFVSRMMKPETLAFFEYKGLTTGWKTYLDRYATVPISEEKHILDRRVIDVLETRNSI
jgi:hypothetical protein